MVVEAAPAAAVQVEEAQAGRPAVDEPRALEALTAGQGSHRNQTMVDLDAVRVRKTFATLKRTAV